MAKDKRAREDKEAEKAQKRLKKDKKEKKAKDGKEKKSKANKKEKKDKRREKHESMDEPQIEVDNVAVSEFLKSNEVEIEDPKKSNVSPSLSFDHLRPFVDSRISSHLEKYAKPTPIQAVVWPYLLKGRDMVGVAETGSGKTMAFGVPAVEHLLKSDSKELQVLIISPTRELASQIYDNLNELTAKVGLECVCVYGGVSKDDQRRAVKRSQCVIATPGRLIDLIEDGSISLDKINYLVLDEADRMLEKGFEEDIKKVMKLTNGNRQTLMFTATWPKEVRELAMNFMDNPVKVTIGQRDELSANKRIQQIVEVVDPREKEQKLLQLLRKYQSGAKKDDKLLIFALYKKEAARVEKTLTYKGFSVAALHGDLNQAQRTQALQDFKTGKHNILLATDVAARGLDIPNVKVVINLTFPLTVEDYVHRIGRTGRAGQKGISHTLFTEHEKHLAGALMNVLRGADQPVPEELLKYGSHTKKKTHGAYGAFFKDVDMTKKAKKITFD
ncbi:hypothetical protein KL925_001912 [Ogataea polymorpha]|nr:hypothetical protein KL925_001912 [Ogataea polymorpha]